MARMQHLTMLEIKSFLRSIHGGRVMSAERRRLLVLVGFWHGLRVTEIVTLTRENIQDGYISVQRLKGSNATIHPFMQHNDPELDEAKALTALAKLLAPGERLFPITRYGAYKFFRSVGKRAGLPKHKSKPHVLKHSICMQTVRKAGVENLRVYVGHKSLASTGAYLKVQEEEACLAIAAAAGKE